MSAAEMPYLLDDLESADMLEIDGLHAFDFQLNEELLDQADAAAEADLPFASEDVVLSVYAQDGREKKTWRFSYNTVMEAQRRVDGSWQLGEHQLRCFQAISASSEE